MSNNTTPKLGDIKKAYLLGIGGVSMSSLAMILKSHGTAVSGYDMSESDSVKKLRKNGIAVDGDFRENALDGVDTLIFSAAIKTDNPYMVEAKRKGIRILTRAELLGLVTAHFPHAIGVAGTHGKSTTTGMLAKICLFEDSDTAVLSGAVLPFLGGMYKAGCGERVVFEACEYKNSYHAMKPTVKVVLNCEHDHVDFFPTLNDVVESFRKYIDTERFPGAENKAVVCLDCQSSVRAAEGTSAEVYYYSVKEKADFYAVDVDMSSGFGNFGIVLNDGERIDGISLRVPGLHNVSNAVAACAAAYICGVSKKSILRGLCEFEGVSRRFEKLGEFGGAVLIDDYAHHPDEIRATLTAANNLPHNRIFCIFQPHTYTRTAALLDEFADSLSLADKVYISDIYAAREVNTSGVSSADIAKRMKNCEYIPSFGGIAEMIKDEIEKGDLVITMGAGEAYKVARILLGKE